MRKALIATVAFIASAILGCIVLLLIAMAVGYVWMALYQRAHSGIYAVAGGISETAVIAVPILCGFIGTLIVLHRIERKSS
jgi:hypothetical protein